MAEEDSKPVFQKHTVEHGVEEYKKVMDQFEDVFFDLEKAEPMDLSDIYIILPKGSKLYKKSLLWGFSLAKRCDSKVHIVTKKTPKIEELAKKVASTMIVEFDFLEEEMGYIMGRIQQDRNLIVLPRDIIEGMKEEKHKGPLLII